MKVFIYNGHEADLVFIRRSLKIKMLTKNETLMIQGTLQEFLIKKDTQDNGQVWILAGTGLR